MAGVKRNQPKAMNNGAKGGNGNGYGITRAVSAPVSMASTVVNTQPKIAYSGRNSCRIVHRELIATISHSVNFAVNSFELNPGISTTFPWLAPMAAQWEQYRFTKLCFHYVTRTATTTVGSVLLAPDYDASDLPPSSEINMASYQDCVEDVPWKNLTCHLNAASMHVIQQRKYLRTGAIPTGTDVKLYDVGNFHVGTTGGASTDAIGKLYVEYDVEFYIPQKTGGTASGSSFAYRQASQTPQGTDKLFSTSGSGSALSTIIAASSAPVGGVFTVPAGNWLFTIKASAESAMGSATAVLAAYIDNVQLADQTQKICCNETYGSSYVANFTYASTASFTVDFRFASSPGVAFSNIVLTAVALC